MKPILFLLLLIQSLKGEAGKINESASSLSCPKTPFNRTLQTDCINFLSGYRVKDLEKITGKKFSLKEKLAFNIYKSRLKKEKKKTKKEQYSKRSKTALILSILSLVTLIFFPVSVVLAIISIVLASKSLKENNEDKKAKTAMGLSILALGLVVVGLLIYGIFVSEGEFGIFVL